MPKKMNSVDQWKFGQRWMPYLDKVVAIHSFIDTVTGAFGLLALDVQVQAGGGLSTWTVPDEEPRGLQARRLQW